MRYFLGEVSVMRCLHPVTDLKRRLKGENSESRKGKPDWLLWPRIRLLSLKLQTLFQGLKMKYISGYLRMKLQQCF
jgi:hypothetical protein